MRVALGIDLGSTTTKAIVLDEARAIVGRGITNSRSNYDVACEIATAEALIDTRFTMLRRQAGADPAAARGVEEALGALERAFRHRQYLVQLEALRDECLRIAAAEPERAGTAATTRSLEAIFAGLVRESAELFAPGARRKSDFFRDLAGSAFQHAAERTAGDAGAGLDRLLGIHDKAILRVENARLDTSFETHCRPAIAASGLDPASAARLGAAAERCLAEPLEVSTMVGTGYGRARLPFPRERIRSEILCHGLGAHEMFPGTLSVLDIGGQDTKAIQLDPDGIVTSFQMNDRCAAGCGRYLGYIADEMNLGVHELAPLAEQATHQVRISSTCTVFAGAELRDRLALGEKREDILAGLHRAIILRAMSLLARAGGVRAEFTFTGGVAKNSVAVKVLRDLVRESYGIDALNISPDSIYTGALGAALFACRDADAPKVRGIEV